jgi:hypothetical protein
MTAFAKSFLIAPAGQLWNDSHTPLYFHRKDFFVAEALSARVFMKPDAFGQNTNLSY